MNTAKEAMVDFLGKAYVAHVEIFMPALIQDAMKIIWTATEASTNLEVAKAMEIVRDDLPVKPQYKEDVVIGWDNVI